MKKVATLAAIVAAGASSLVLAEGFKAELGYQTDNVSSNYADCWQECYGDGEPSGFAVGLSYDVNDQITVSADMSMTEDTDDTYNDGVERTNDRTAIQVSYSFEQSDTADVFVALNYAMNDWEYLWADSNGSDYTYESEASGVSVKLGATKALGDDTSLTSSVSLGFEEGVEVAVETALTEKVGMKVSYASLGYDSDEFLYTSAGTPSTPSDTNGDADYSFDNTALRVSATYAF